MCLKCLQTICLRSFSLLLLYSTLSYADFAHPPVSSHCQVRVNDFQFGTYNPFSPQALSSTTQVTLRCIAHSGVSMAYQIGASRGSGRNYNNRALINTQNNRDALHYNLYINPQMSLIWGDGRANTEMISDHYIVSGHGLVSKNYTIYGKIPARQEVSSGEYQDRIIVMVDY